MPLAGALAGSSASPSPPPLCSTPPACRGRNCRLLGRNYGPWLQRGISRMAAQQDHIKFAAVIMVDVGQILDSWDLVRQQTATTETESVSLVRSDDDAE
jgi:hypothetical protein